MECKFYMQEIGVLENLIAGTRKDLEVDFQGLKYVQAKGINKIGKPRIYQEKYAEKDGVRVYVPQNVTNDSTTIELELLFTGEKRQSVFDSFNAYIRNGRHLFWDTLRKKKFPFVVSNEIEPKEENFKGTPFIRVTYKLTNLHGKCDAV